MKKSNSTIGALLLLLIISLMKIQVEALFDGPNSRFIVAIYLKTPTSKTEQLLCSGSYIHPRIVLTAATCICDGEVKNERKIWGYRGLRTIELESMKDFKDWNWVSEYSEQNYFSIYPSYGYYGNQCREQNTDPCLYGEAWPNKAGVQICYNPNDNQDLRLRNRNVGILSTYHKIADKYNRGVTTYLPTYDLGVIIDVPGTSIKVTIYGTGEPDNVVLKMQLKRIRFQDTYSVWCLSDLEGSSANKLEARLLGSVVISEDNTIAGVVSAVDPNEMARVRDAGGELLSSCRALMANLYGPPHNGQFIRIFAGFQSRY